MVNIVVVVIGVGSGVDSGSSIGLFGDAIFAHVLIFINVLVFAHVFIHIFMMMFVVMMFVVGCISFSGRSYTSTPVLVSVHLFHHGAGVGGIGVIGTVGNTCSKEVVMKGKCMRG